MNNKKYTFEVDPGIIIDRPSLVSRTRKFTEFTVGVVGWMLWFFLVRPFVLLLTWYLAYRIFAFQMFQLEGIENPILYERGFIAVFVIFLLMLFWNRYNVWRFRRKDRRKSRGVAGNESMGAFYRISPESVEQIRNSPITEVYFYGNDTIELLPKGLPLINAYYNPIKTEKMIVSNRTHGLFPTAGEADSKQPLHNPPSDSQNDPASISDVHGEDKRKP